MPESIRRRVCGRGKATRVKTAHAEETGLELMDQETVARRRGEEGRTKEETHEKSSASGTDPPRPSAMGGRRRILESVAGGDKAARMASRGEVRGRRGRKGSRGRW